MIFVPHSATIFLENCGETDNKMLVGKI